MAVRHTPEGIGLPCSPIGHVAEAGVDQVCMVAMRAFALDVASMPARTALLSAFDAVMEAGHLCITLSL